MQSYDGYHSFLTEYFISLKFLYDDLLHPTGMMYSPIVKQGNSMVRRLFQFILIFIFISNNVLLFAQEIPLAIMQTAPAIMPLKTLRDTFPEKIWRAGSGLLAAEVTPWVFDKYILHADYANISLQSLGYNINPKNWDWDGDGFTTNQFAHPYHGSFYFNAFRTNGYNFWRSSLATVAGSYIWETAGENQAPAPNDLINTSFGGIVLGEMVFRLSNRISSNHFNGRKRKLSKILALAINPMNGLSRILNNGRNTMQADAFRDTTPVATEFDIGLRKFRANNIDNNIVFHGRVKLAYGSVYQNYKTPFSNIFINIEFGNDDSSKINIVSVYGSLRGWKLEMNSNAKHMAMLSANYDFIKNEAFFYSAQSVRLSLYSLFERRPAIKINTLVGGGLILLSAVPDKYGYKGRYYDYCWGAGFNGSFNASFANRFFCGISYRGGWLKTTNGNPSYYFLHTINGELRYRVLKNISVCTEPGYFSLKGFYRKYDNVNKPYPYIRISVRYSLEVK